MAAKQISLARALAVLGLTGQRLSPELVKLTYRKLAMTQHPDRGGDAKKFSELNEAYELVKDVKADGSFAGPASPWGGMFGRNASTAGGDLDDMLDWMNKVTGQAKKAQQAYRQPTEAEKIKNQGLEAAIEVLRSWRNDFLSKAKQHNLFNKEGLDVDTLFDAVISDVNKRKV